MARDDRDRNFERALARHGQWELAASNAQSPNIVTSQSSNCADAETLAAYHERLLAPEELAFWKGHIISCVRCQEILAQLEITDQIPLAALEQEDAQVQPALARSPVMMPAPATASIAARPATVRSIAESAHRQPDSSDKEKDELAAGSARKAVSITNWRWLAPLGAVAAVLLIWISVHEHQQSVRRNTSSAPTEVAMNEPPAPAPSRVNPEKELPPSEIRKKEGSLTGDDFSPEANRAKSAQPKVAQPESRQRISQGQIPESAAAAHGIPDNRDSLADSLKQRSLARHSTAIEPNVQNFLQNNQQNLSAALPMNGRNSAPSQPLKSEAKAGDTSANGTISPEKPQSLAESVGVNSTVPAPVTLSPGAGNLSPGNDKDAPAAKKFVPANATVVPAPTAATAEAQGSLFRDANRKVLPLIFSRDNKTVWRIEPGGVIERSSDHGLTWIPQISGVAVDLAAGSAPNESVCWIVGKGGTVLRTLDSGEHWQMLSVPTKDDLAKVAASDHLRAKIGDVSGQKIYVTADGGVTWTDASPK